ncbi:hypothetical protein [Paenibacillus sedimenti]|uniref:Uncharacterized protein n=1 Tax=Paenibacillus sedimenti TaxID=2770274 RepID=A0A926KPR7_9BACL|nr:hypothetical protein [Paenibacillus sedimenti]MBD0381063.1 hypothetical protein [Paenibacillus sedimenti]
MNRKLWIGGTVGLFLGVILIIGYFTWGRTNDRLNDVLRAVQPTVTPPPTPTPSGPAPAELEKRLSEIRDWKIAERRFTTDSREPLILLHNDKQIVYIQNNQIRYEVVGGSGFQNIPLSFPSARTGYVWRDGKTAYIGLSTGSESNRKQGDWYEINLTAAAGNPLKRLGELQLAPEEVQAVRFSNKPLGALFLEKKADSYQEFWINGQGKGQFFVNDYSIMKDPKGKQLGAISADQAVFDRVHEYNNLFVMEDERGLLVYQNGQLSPSIFRLSGYKLGQAQSITVDESLRSQPPYSGSNAILLSIMNVQEGSLKGILLPANSPTPFSLAPKLMEEGWTLVGGLSFVRMKEGLLQTISYPMNEGIEYPEQHEAAVPVADISKLTRSGMVVQGEKEGVKQYLSLNDVMNTRSEAAGPALWMRMLQPGRMVKAEKQDTASKEIFMKFPQIPSSVTDALNDDAIPEGLRNALKQRDYLGSGDIASTHVVRKSGDEWHVLTDERMEQWDGVQGLKELGRLPVKTHCTTSNYVICTTAADFAKVDGFWYVADTYHNRILKLDDRFGMIEQVNFPMPTKLFFTDDGKLLNVEGLQGVASYTMLLEQVSLQPAAPITVDKLPKEEIAASPEGFYEDSNRMQWVFQSNRLYVYDPNKQTVLTHFTGAMTNMAGTAKIIPYSNKVLLVLDDRIHVFDIKGHWLKEISFPRTQPDGIYVSTPKGENTYALDHELGMLYLIQGFRLLRIDLNDGEVTPLFWQLNANMSKVQMDRGKLYLTFQTANGYDAPDAHNEMVICDIKTGRLTRFKISEGFTLDRITKVHELILIPQSDFSSIVPASWMVYKLNEQGMPE